MLAGTEIPGGGGGTGGGGRLYLTLHCHHQNDFCIKMGSDESHLNVSLTVRDKVMGQCPQTMIFKETERRAEAESNLGPSAHAVASLTPYRWAISARKSCILT